MTETYAPETTGNDTRDATEGRKARVKFGPKAHQTVPHEWAERMLTRLFQTNRKAFGVVLQHAAGIDNDE
jgi:hypothetical protein